MFPFCIFAFTGFAECVQCLLDAGAEKEFVSSSNYTPLMIAIQNRKPEVVRLLLSRECSPNFRGGLQWSPLHIAARNGNSEIADILIDKRAAINARDSDGNTPLILSAQNGHYGVMKSLMNAGCDINAANKKGMTALHYTCHKARGFNLLLEAGADPDVRASNNVTPLFLAASEGFDGVVKALVERECDVNIADDTVKRTALHILAFKGHKDSIIPLANGGADISLCDIYNHTPLWYAVQNKKVDVVRLLLKCYSHVDTYQCMADSSSENCPARLAFELKLFDVIKCFILSGYDHCHVRECLQSNEYSDWLKTNKDFDHWSLSGASAQTLKQLCRKWIRHHLGRHFYHNLQSLPLPSIMKNYLYLEELHDH